MNQQITTRPESTGLPMTSVGMATGAAGARIAPQNLGEVVKFAQVMSRADIALPKHLRGNDGACMAVALQALDWQMNPFAVASKSYAVNGVIAYEAQLIAAVVNTRSGIEGRLRYQFDGEGNALTCKVTGTLDGTECEYETPPFGAITVKNSPLWKSDPRQQLGYYAARAWARRHCPEVLLGVYDRDEASSMKDVTPSGTGLADRLQGGGNGFDAEQVELATQEATGARNVSEAVVDAEFEETAPAASNETTNGQFSPDDDDVRRDAASAAIDGRGRTPPDDLAGEQIAIWFSAYDEVLEDGAAE